MEYSLKAKSSFDTLYSMYQYRPVYNIDIFRNTFRRFLAKKEVKTVYSYSSIRRVELDG